MDIKLGTELNVAIDTPENIRDRSRELSQGFDSELNSWRLIIKYTGSLEDIARDYDATVTELLGGFAIIVIDEERILDLARDSRIIYIEKPKLFVQGRTTINGFVQSCMSLPYFERGLRGGGIAVAVVDSGIDIFHPEFWNEVAGVRSTKVLALWDQTVYGNPPMGYGMGTIFDEEEINRALRDSDNTFLSRDVSGHGTAVAGIITACTPEAGLLIVKLDTSGKDETDTINLMLGIDFAIRYSIENNAPLVINLSYGNNAGDHDGNSVLEKYIDTVALLTKVTFAVGAGNDGVAGRHIQINMGNESYYKRDFLIPDGEGSISIQIWRDYQDQMDVFLNTPSGEAIGPFNDFQQVMTYTVDNMNIRVLNSGPSPINTSQETYISIIPLGEYIESGLWSISINPKMIISGRVDAWLPAEGGTNTNLYFLNPTDSTTFTIPSSSQYVISVGAYDSNTLSYAAFSGRGYTVDGGVKPDIVAPGVNIDVPRVGGGYERVSGTSFATPFVSSGSAMLMEYGIVDNNDPFLYGEKVKAYLIAGAKALPGFMDVPNTQTGWGALCVEDSLPS